MLYQYTTTSTAIKEAVAATATATTLFLLPEWILLTDNMQDVSLCEPQPCVLTRNVRVLLRIIVKQRPQPDPGLPPSGRRRCC